MPKIASGGLRIDKWLWAVRLYKTRSLAATACNNNQVSIEGVNVKPSRAIKIGDVINVKRPPITRTYKVIDLLEQRQSAKIAAEFIEDITPEEEIDKLQLARLQKAGVRDKGLGRPTKKDRRDIENIGFI